MSIFEEYGAFKVSLFILSTVMCTQNLDVNIALKMFKTYKSKIRVFMQENKMVLKRTRYTCRFPPIFNKGDNLCDFLFAFLL